MKILAIDDHPDNLTTLKAVVGDSLPECILLTAPSGPRGLELARAEDPDVILLDIVMPDMDGFEVCRLLKADECLASIPVVFLTALRTDRESRVEALAVGAEAFLSKPIDEQELVAMVRAMTKLKAANRMQRLEKEHLAALVAERTQELKHELAERQRVEEALRESEARFRYMSEVAPVLLWKSGPDAGYDYFNQRWLDFTGRTIERELGNGWWEGLHPADSQACQETYRAAFDARQKFKREFRLRRADGEYRWLLDNGIPCFTSDGLFTGFIGSCVDITLRKRTEEELLNLRTAVEQSANPIVITDRRGTIEYVNPAFEKNTGYSAAEAIGRNPRILKSGSQDVEFYRELWATIASGKIWRGEFHNKRKDGSLYWESATLSPVLNDRGEILHFIAVKEDITERKAMEAMLSEALLRAETAAHAKSEFLAVMSHELRTPLNGVLGFAELLSYTPLNDEQKGYAETISISGHHLLSVVNDILDFSSMEKGRLAIHAVPFAIGELVKSADSATRKAAVDKRLDFRTELDPGVPEQITGDERRIRQILINLLGNAVKFTSRGSVVLRVAPASVGGRPVLNFSVTDTGLGISSELLDRLFQPFSQADSKLSRQFEGTGLGLAISKRLAEAMDGSISVASTPGQGSTFTFHLPLEIASSAPGSLAPDDRDSAAASGELVLVVEDDPDSAKLAGKMLRSLGFRAEFATHGAAAVEAFVPGKYFTILMDMRMPVMDGLDATKRIRELESGSHVPIIALTANVMPGDRERCLDGGMDDYLSKPFRRDQLEAILPHVSGGSPGRPQPDRG